MAISVHWGTKVITVPQSDLLQVQATPIEVYELNINDLRLTLRDLEDDAAGIPFSDTHVYNPPITVAGTTLARVVEILAPYTLTFEPDLPYGVNVVGGNSNIPDRTNPNNVSVRSDNSAGLQDGESLQAASFGGHVTIDVINGVTGTTFPRGTQQTPVNNLADARDIAVARGISQFLIQNDMTFDSISMADGYVFFAEKNNVVVTINPGIDVTNATFRDLTVTGTLDGNNHFVGCEVFDVVSLNGVLENCGIMGTITLAGSTLTSLINCHSDVAGGGAGQFANIDMGGSGNSLLVRDYSGGLGIENYSGGGDISIDMDSGRVTIHATVTAGDITVRGIAEVIDNSTGTATVDDRTLSYDVEVIRRLLQNKTVTDPFAGTFTVYADDDTTILFQASLWEDAAGTVPYTGTGAERRERLA